MSRFCLSVHKEDFVVRIKKWKIRTDDSFFANISKLVRPLPNVQSVILSIFLLTADIISTVEFNHDGELLATGDKGGRIVIFQRENAVSINNFIISVSHVCWVSLAFLTVRYLDILS